MILCGKQPMPFLTSIMHGKKEPVSYFIALLLRNKKNLYGKGAFSEQNWLMIIQIKITLFSTDCIFKMGFFEPLLKKNHTKQVQNQFSTPKTTRAFFMTLRKTLRPLDSFIQNNIPNRFLQYIAEVVVRTEQVLINVAQLSSRPAGRRSFYDDRELSFAFQRNASTRTRTCLTIFRHFYTYYLSRLCVHD